MQSNYVANVMRLKVGDAVFLFNGQDGEWRASIIAASKNHVELLAEELMRDQGTEPDIWLIFAPIKAGRIDFLVEKATELGTSHLLPVLTQRTIVDKVNLGKLKAYAVEAAEQSERITVPEIADLQKLPKLLENWDETRKIILCDESGKAGKFSEILTPFCHSAARQSRECRIPGGDPALPLRVPQDDGVKWAILIGPEGGFTAEEFQMLYNKPYIVPVSLGPRILRADTAALAALALWQEIIGDASV